MAIAQLKAAHEEDKYYGVVSLALKLDWSKKKTRRVRNLAGVVAAKRTKRHGSASGKAEILAPANALMPYVDFKDPDRPQDGQSYTRMAEADAWVQDFTYVWFRGVWVYIATVIDLKTRRVVGWSIDLRHDKALVHRAILDALSKYPPPSILHSDQGSEYLSYLLRELCAKMEITLSCSDRSSPWQNGFQERFYGTLKNYIYPVSQYKDLAELYEGIALAIYHYNYRRIHTVLKMSPAAYAATIQIPTNNQNKNPTNQLVENGQGV